MDPLMGEGGISLWFLRGAYIVLTMGVLFVQLMPVSLMPVQWAPPDVMLAISLAWAQRRRGILPVWLVAGTFFLLDVMFQRPPGVWAALALLAVEWFKTRERQNTEVSFVIEWLSVAGSIVIMTLLYRGVLIAAAVDAGPLHLATSQSALTVALYPLVVFASHFIFGIRRTSANETDPKG